MEFSFQSGAQYLSTVYPEVSPFDSNYKVSSPGINKSARSNPVSAPVGSDATYLEE